MADPVQLSVRSSLDKVIKELESVKEKAGEVGDSLKQSGQEVGSGVERQTKRTGRFLNDLSTLGRRVANRLASDFSALGSVASLKSAFSLGEQFSRTVGETTELSDTVRRLGAAFGIAKRDFVDFQSSLVKGLGDIGLSSESAARSLEGLADLPITGQDNLIGYTRTAGMLAGIGNEQGQEGQIASLLFRTIRATGRNPNDMDQVNNLADQIKRITRATGRTPTESLGMMRDLFTGMAADFRRQLGPEAITQISAIQTAVGPQASKFIEDYLTKGPIARRPFEAQGGRGIFDEGGFNAERFQRFASGIIGRVRQDPRFAAQTLGMGEAEAEGFIRLYEQLDRVGKVQASITEQNKSLEQSYRDAMGLGEAFRANINRVSSGLSEVIASISQGATDLLGTTAKSDTGAAAVTLGGGLLAAILAGVGLRGAGRALGIGGTLARGVGAEAITGEDTIPVYVVNASEIGGGGMAAAAAGAGGLAGMGRVLPMIGKGGLVGLAAAAGIGLGKLIEPYLKKVEKETVTKSKDGIEYTVFDRAFQWWQDTFGTELSKQQERWRAQANQLDWMSPKERKIQIELNKKQLKMKGRTGASASF